MNNSYKNIVDDLLNWYDQNRRKLRWRDNPKPYFVWVSEIMLQQTRVEAVKSYFDRFIEQLPTIEDLAYEQEERLLKLWEGLGYYNRVKNLQKAAVIIMDQYAGDFPGEYEKLLTLPGIGPYTAAAIASIAFQQKVAAVDGNVLRVMMRVAGSYEDISKQSVKNELQRKLNEIIPNRPGDFNQAVMDLGSAICIPNGKPLCNQCPIQKHCVAFQTDIVMELPVKPKKKERRIEEKTVLVLQRGAEYAIHKRKERGVLEGLWEYPNLSGKVRKKDILDWCKEQGFEVIQSKKLPNAKHIFSHVEWRMTGYYLMLKESKGKEITAIDSDYNKEELVWEEARVINEKYALPGAFQAFRTYMLEK